MADCVRSDGAWSSHLDTAFTPIFKYTVQITAQSQLLLQSIGEYFFGKYDCCELDAPDILIWTKITKDSGRSSPTFLKA